MAFHQQYVSIEQPAIGQLMRELRQTLKLTQEKFAVQLGVTFPTINRWENEHATSSPLALKQIEMLLNQLSYLSHRMPRYGNAARKCVGEPRVGRESR